MGVEYYYLTNKRDMDLRARDRELRAEMQDMLSTVKQEKRKFTNEELSKFEDLKSERQRIMVELESGRELDVRETPVDLSKRFAKACEQTLRSGSQQLFEVRANNVLAETGINDSQVPVLLQSIIEPLQENFILNKLGMEVLNGVHGEPVWSVESAIEASVEGENTEVRTSKLDFSALKSKPKRIAVAVPVSNRAVSQSNYDLYGIVTRAMGRAVARKLNQIVVSDVAVGDFNGLFQDLDTKNKITAPLDWGGVVDLEGAVLNNNVNTNLDRSAYVLNTKSYTALKKTVVEKGDSKMVVDVNNFTLNGYKLLVSNFVKDGKALFGDFSQSVAVSYGNASLIVDPFTHSRENLVMFVLNMDADVVRFRKEAFAQMTIKAPSTP